MAAFDSGKIIRKVRHRLEVSQEGLSRLMNTTKGAVQHWERGRTHPGLGRLLVLRQLCPTSPERKELDALIHQTRNGAAPAASIVPGIKSNGTERHRAGNRASVYPPEGLLQMRRENGRLQRQVTKLEACLKRKQEQLRILESLATDLQREMARMRAGQ